MKTPGRRVASANVDIDGPELRKRRKLAGYTIIDFAGRCNISWGYLSQIERGGCRVSPPVFVRICDALKIPADERDCLIRSEHQAVA